MSVLDTLKPLRDCGGHRLTTGLDDATIEQFALLDSNLGLAIERAGNAFKAVSDEFADLLQLDERDQIEQLQADFINFYATDAVNPYVALAAAGCGPSAAFSLWRLRRGGPRLGLAGPDRPLRGGSALGLRPFQSARSAA